MTHDFLLSDEPGRQAALDRYQILDTAPEEAFDKITGLVRTVLGVPIAIVSLIDHNRQWLKSVQGSIGVEMPRNQSFCTHTIRTREPMLIPDATQDPRFAANPAVLGPPFLRSYAGVPLQSPEGYNVGALCAIDTVPRTFEAAQIEILTHFAALVVDEFELRMIARSDFLTGAMTRRAFMAELSRAKTRSLDQGSLIAIDIDHFKSINDSLGHAAGDGVLVAIAACCAASLRKQDAFGRIGGEEFCILLPGTSTTDAVEAAERLRHAVATLAFPAHPTLQVTASFGIAPLQPGDVSASLAKADAALYAAKHAGRNRYALADAD